MSEAKMLDAQTDSGSLVAPSSEQALLATFHGQQDMPHEHVGRPGPPHVLLRI